MTMVAEELCGALSNHGNPCATKVSTEQQRNAGDSMQPTCRVRCARRALIRGIARMYAWRGEQAAVSRRNNPICAKLRGLAGNGGRVEACDRVAGNGSWNAIAILRNDAPR